MKSAFHPSPRTVSWKLRSQSLVMLSVFPRGLHRCLTGALLQPGFLDEHLRVRAEHVLFVGKKRLGQGLLSTKASPRGTVNQVLPHDNSSSASLTSRLAFCGGVICVYAGFGLPARPALSIKGRGLEDIRDNHDRATFRPREINQAF